MAYEKAFENIPVGQRWRLGSNYWTNFSSSFPIRSGEQSLAAGYYYLVLEKAAAESWKLLFLNPDDIQKLQIDPWHVNRQASGSARFALDLLAAAQAEPSEALEIKLKLNDESPREFQIDIRFGPIHLVTTSARVELH